MIDQIVEKYITLRDLKAQYKAEYEAKTAEITAALDRIETHLLAKMQEQGVKSFPTAAGTAYLQHRSSASIGDWDSYKRFCAAQEDPFLFFDKRPNKTVLDEYRQANGELPPGINWRESVVVNVKRS